ncbi:diaminopimelate dehydrogenase [Clostridium massiliamazoniense]|uniref:diaminopimelate dehydrogenase n=1 Tax=Clostridium massiliamazoniense TaxID=1347366 RepID=UPI0006D85761|nr:diaminopimelate dehydrogenase [Clostridium massiliamazoniense]
MENKIRIGIVGYGNLGRGVLKSVAQNPDMSVEAIFTRRNNVEVEGFGPATNISEIEKFKDKIDVMILCGGSATDLPKQGPEISKYFNTVDSFDTHAKIPEYFEAVDKSAKESGKLSIISVGWDPGLFSLNRVYAESILPEGKTYTFWGKGVSQGHSDAIRRVEGVKNGVQYTVPKEEALEKVRTGANPELTTREKHLRVCYVVLDEGADKEKVANEIKTMPNYFDEYDTVVNFISEEEFNKEHRAMPHGGFVIRSGKTGAGNNEKIEFSLQLDSNPEFTSSVLTAYARAIYRMAKEGRKGAITVFDVAPSYLSTKSASELRKELL